MTTLSQETGTKGREAEKRDFLSKACCTYNSIRGKSDPEAGDKRQEACAFFREAAQIDPLDVFPHYGVGSIKQELGDLDEAAKRAAVIRRLAARPGQASSPFEEKLAVDWANKFSADREAHVQNGHDRAGGSTLEVQGP